MPPVRRPLRRPSVDTPETCEGDHLLTAKRERLFCCILLRGSTYTDSEGCDYDCGSVSGEAKADERSLRRSSLFYTRIFPKHKGSLCGHWFTSDGVESTSMGLALCHLVLYLLWLPPLRVVIAACNESRERTRAAQCIRCVKVNAPNLTESKLSR